MQKIFSGKVRDTYNLEDGTLVVVTTDRVSAFDSVLPTEIPGKGIILNKMSAFWFGITKNIIDNHMITIDNYEMPDLFRTPKFEGRSMLVKKLEMLPIECVARGYITGSGWKSYQEKGEVCGIKLPKGLRESERLPEPIYSPTTKATIGHDMPITFEETIDILGDETLAKKVKETSIILYSFAQQYALKRGIIIADTKFEYGLDQFGNLVLGDEILTPDSSRFWQLSNYAVGRPQNSFDKQYLRDYIKNCKSCGKSITSLPTDVIFNTYERYCKAYDILLNN